jgi:hypothetical protein
MKLSPIVQLIAALVTPALSQQRPSVYDDNRKIEYGLQ